MKKTVLPCGGIYISGPYTEEEKREAYRLMFPTGAAIRPRKKGKAKAVEWPEPQGERGDSSDPQNS